MKWPAIQNNLAWCGENRHENPNYHLQKDNWDLFLSVFLINRELFPFYIKHNADIDFFLKYNHFFNGYQSIDDLRN